MMLYTYILAYIRAAYDTLVAHLQAVADESENREKNVKQSKYNSDQLSSC